MSPPVDAVAPTGAVPKVVDVVVIGGGIVGTSAAYFLARKGLRVALCEKGRIGGEQSSRNWGWCRAMGRDTREVPLILESLRVWDNLAAMLGTDVGFRRPGIYYLFEKPEEADSYGPWLEQSRLHQIGSRLVSAADVQAAMPRFARPIAGALHTPSDGRAEPSMAAPAIARGTQALGGAVLTDCAVRTIETSGGTVCGVVTERGRIDCRAAVLAGGAWSRLFCGNIGIELPQLKVLGSVLRTAPTSGGPECSAAGSEFAFRKRLDGGYSVAHGGVSTAEVTPDSFRLFQSFFPALRSEWKHLRLNLGRQFVVELKTPRRWAADAVSPFETTRVLDPVPDHALLDTAVRAFRAAHPAFAAATELQRWAGLIDVTPDAVPVISPGPTPGFFIATGFSGHGFGLGPGAGRLMADLVTGDAPIVDPTPFRFSRFTDGSPIQIEGGL